MLHFAYKETERQIPGTFDKRNISTGIYMYIPMGVIVQSCTTRMRMRYSVESRSQARDPKSQSVRLVLRNINSRLLCLCWTARSRSPSLSTLFASLLPLLFSQRL